MEELTIDDEATDPSALDEDPSRGARQALTTIWIIHAIVLVLTSIALLAASGLLGLVEKQQDAMLAEHVANLAYARAVLDSMAPLIPFGLILAPIVLVAAIGFARRRAWGWQGIHLLTWLHLLLIPALGIPIYDLAQIPPPNIGPGGMDNELFNYFNDQTRWLNLVINGALLAVMEGLLIWMLVSLRRPHLHAAFQSSGSDESSS